MMSVVTQSLVDMQEAGGMQWRFAGSNDVFVLKLPVILWLGDAVGNDKLVALRGGQSNPQCRYCRCPFEEMGNPEASHRYTNMSELRAKCISHPHFIRTHGYYPLKRNATHRICYCDSIGGINQCTPAEMLHQIERGTLEYAHIAFSNLMCHSDNGQTVFTPQLLKRAEKKMLQIGFNLKHQSDRNLPKTYFRSGYIPNKERGGKKRRGMKRSGQEMSGVILVILIFLQSTDRHHVQPIIRRMGEDKLDGYVHIFSRILLLLEFLKQESIPREDVARLHNYYRSFFEYFLKVIDRKEGAGSNIRKFHYMLHTASDIVRFGVPNNYTGHVPEALFKHHKNDARRTQKRSHTIDFQQGTRYVEGILLNRVHAELTSKRDGKPSFFWGKEPVAVHKKIGADVIIVSFTFYEGGDVDVFLTPKRFRANLLVQRWQGRYISLDSVTDFLKNHLGPAVDKDDYEVSLVTEVRVQGVRYKANPLLRSAAWHDWAYVKTDLFGCTPCHLLCFFRIRGIRNGNIPLSLTNNTIGDGVYALCHYLPEDPFTDSRQKVLYGNNDPSYHINPNCTLVRWSCKVTAHSHRNFIPRLCPPPKLGLVSIDHIAGPAIAIPDDDQDFPHTWHVVAGRGQWPSLMSALLCEHVPDTERVNSILEELMTSQSLPL